MEKSKAEKSPWVKKIKKKRPKEERKCHAKKTLPKATKALGLAKRPSASSASVEDPECSKTLWAQVLPLPLPLALCPLLSGRPELNCTERDKKCVAMRRFSLQIVIYCHRH